MERVTVDYTRFNEIEDEDDDAHQQVQKSGVVEFSDDVSQEERQKLEKILTGTPLVSM